MKQPLSFDAITVPLQESNLIEASAGTGKTYSIAILFLRLILEKKLTVKEILMVTFTKAAVAELEERIRLFVRNAYKVSVGERIKDQMISKIVNGYADKEEAQRLLNAAVLFLDETSVLTIHSFCQKTLNEFAFETKQQFGTETMQDTTAVIEEEVNKFWRKHITSIPAELLSELSATGLSRKSIQQVVKEHLSGKRYFPFLSGKDYSYCDEDHVKIISKLKTLKFEVDNLIENIHDYIIGNKEQLTKKIKANGRARDFKMELLDTPEELRKVIANKKAAKYIKEVFEEALLRCYECTEAEKKVAELTTGVINNINCHAINIVATGIQTYKFSNNKMSFDDMIVNLHEALVIRKNERLVKELQKKYKAVFIDEFQDTDRLQYELFQSAFSSNTILFYIGDPKQSIYAWRKADIFTYFKAYDDVTNVYDMNQNFRSSFAMIEAMNIFFKPNEAFDTFYFGEVPHAIKYIPVNSPDPNTKGLLLNGLKLSTPVTITKLPNNDDICKAATAQVIELLENKSYKLGTAGNERGVHPSDIGIIVRSNRQARDMKSMLSKYGIPAVTIGDEKVLETQEATYLLYLLEAMIDNSRAAINKALLSPFTGFSARDIINLDDEKALGHFKEYKSRWLEDGIYTALIDFVSDCNVQTVLLGNNGENGENGERIISNLYQLIELVHKVQTTRMFSPLELISWLKRGIEGEKIEGDEYEQRIESDEEAVKIVTIHKSKGLEYKIVLAPFLDLKPKEAKSNENPIMSFHDEQSGQYISIESKCMTDEQKKTFLEQEEQENRRLIYVAITRAVYKCFIYRNTYYKDSSLATFTNALVNTDPSLIEKAEALSVPEKYNYTKMPWEPVPKIEGVQFGLSNQNWTQMSYSRLAAKHTLPTFGFSKEQANPYDHFVFRQLAKGERSGNMLHQIFETIHYTYNKDWPKVMSAAISKYAPRQKALYETSLPVMIEQVLQANISVGETSLTLSHIDYSKRMHEFEFDFPVSPFQVSALNELSDEEIQVNVKGFGELEGIMNGKIDLFFEHNGRYYILDWKSNYLGDSIEDYSPTALATAMNDHNYHLQYLIYTLAVKKYLQTRLPNFNYESDFGGVIYMFIRGVRKGATSGVFSIKPSVEKIGMLEEILEGVAEVG